MKKTKRSYNLRERTVDVMHLINSFGKRHNIKDEVEINMVDDTLQMVKKKYMWNVSTLFLCKFI